MKSYPSTRYRCDHCSKTSGSAPAMKRHETGCTANPARACRFCAAAHIESKPVAALVAALGTGDEAGLASLRELAQGCPACILAAIRQSKLQTGYNGPDDEGFRVAFDFKKEKEAWWAEVNDAADNGGCY